MALTLSDVRGEVASALVAVAVVRENVDEARAAFVASLEAARRAGATNQEIGDVLGVSRQRVSQMLRKDVGR